MTNPKRLRHGDHPAMRKESRHNARRLAKEDARRSPRSTCEHPEFTAEVDVNRLTDSGGFSADVRIRCAACDEPFVFVGSLLSGLSSEEPRVNMDGTELRAPIQPRSWGRTGIVGYAGFDVHVEGKA